MHDERDGENRIWKVKNVICDV